MAVALNPAQLERIRSVFDEALSLPSDRRDAFIRNESDGDELIRSELSSLLKAYDASEGYFEKLSEDLIAPALSASEGESGADSPLHDLKLSRYEVLERIAGGGMGVVYKARDTQLGRTVALKFLPKHYASNATARARLLAEARAASRLDHPHIGVVYEIGEADDGRQFIAMGWYDGETLKDRIRRGPLEIAEAVAIATQLGEALAEAHAKGIIHRDVKPANVMLTPSGGVKLVDFGIAKLMTEDDSVRSGIAGTIAYMSPEQTEEATLDARTDVWSLGVVLFEMLTGVRPFRGDSDAEVVSAIRNTMPPATTSLRTDIPPLLARSVERCLQKERNGRYQTATAFCDDMRLLAGATTSPRIDRRVVNASALVVLAIAAVPAWHYGRAAYRERAAMQALVRSVAVLPFEGSSTNDSKAYLNDAIAEDLRTDLGRFRSITVPSYLSSTGYSGSKTPELHIAKGMGANYFITGEVEAAPTGFAFDLHLVDARTGREVLSRRYRSTNARVDITREAIREIASALDIRLTQEESNQLRVDRTTNANAYDLYLRGLSAELSGIPRAALGRTSPASIRTAQGFYAQARTLDPGFSSARSRLAASHIASVLAYDTTRSRLEEARIEAEATLRIDPRLAEAHAALAGYWQRLGNADRSVEELKLGLQSLPNDVGLHIALGKLYIEIGRWEDGAAEFERALRLDPRNPIAASRAAMSYGRLNRNAEALKAFNRFIAISPTDNEVRLIKGHAYLRWKGTTDTLITELENIPAGWDDRGMATFAWYTALRIERRFRDGLSMLDRSRSQLSRDGLVYYPTSLMRADLLHDLGYASKANLSYERAHREIGDSAAANPSDASVYAALALSDAGLGRKRVALQEVQHAIDLARRANSAMSVSATMGNAVEVFGRVGELDRAFETMDLLFAMPAGREATIHYLQLWPGFDPLRKDPRFYELLQRFGVKQ